VTGLAVSPAQLIHQMLEIRRGTQSVRAKRLSQPFAYAITDRSAGLTIDIAIVGDSAVHIEFRFVSIQGVTQDQVSGATIVSLSGSIAYLSSKNFMKAARGSTGSNSNESPGLTGPGL
jgi:hypothetical protein